MSVIAHNFSLQIKQLRGRNKVKKKKHLYKP